jgi:hypothetical protein
VVIRSQERKSNIESSRESKSRREIERELLMQKRKQKQKRKHKQKHKQKQKRKSSTGLEPAISRFVGGCLIHWATKTPYHITHNTTYTYNTHNNQQSTTNTYHITRSHKHTHQHIQTTQHTPLHIQHINTRHHRHTTRSYHSLDANLVRHVGCDSVSISISIHVYPADR